MASKFITALGRFAGKARHLLPGLTNAPQTGQITGAQFNPPAGSPFGSCGPAIPGFGAIQNGTYDIYRKISSHPTVAEVMSIVKAPIMANAWTWQKRPDAPEIWRTFIQENIDPLRTAVLKDALRALEFGCWKFEKVYEERSGKLVLRKLKSLAVDPQFTQILVDPNTGDFLGLQQTGADGNPIFLPPSKCFLYTHDGEPGQYHGRSRHENIRKDYFRYEEVAQRVAQYLRKVAGIIVQLHYPDGTSKTASGADFPNDWIAQQILDAVSEGRSIRFQNLFSSIASSADLRPADMEIAAKLAGESQWKLSAIDVGSGADHARGLLDALAYYDKLLFRGWQRSERVGLEAQSSASRADSRTHSDTGLIDSELIEADFVAAFCLQVIDDLLVLNFGETARGAVWPEPTPIADDQIGQAHALIAQGLSNPQGFAVLSAKIDWDTLLGQAGIPVDKQERGSVQNPVSPELIKQPSNHLAARPSSVDSSRLELAGFNTDQARDEKGKWTAVAGKSIGTEVAGVRAKEQSGEPATKPTTSPYLREYTAVEAELRAARSKLKLAQQKLSDDQDFREQDKQIPKDISPQDLQHIMDSRKKLIQDDQEEIEKCNQDVQRLENELKKLPKPQPNNPYQLDPDFINKVWNPKYA